MEPYSCDEVTQAPIPEHYHLHRLLKSSYGICQAALEELTGYEDCNFLLSDMIWEVGTGPSRAILKVSNPLEAKCDENIGFATHVDQRMLDRCQSIKQRNCRKNPLFIVGRKSVGKQVALITQNKLEFGGRPFKLIKLCRILNEKGVPCPTTIKRLDGRDWAREEIADGVHLPVRLFEVIPGSNLENFTYDYEVAKHIGELLARFHIIADESKLSVTHVPYIAVEHRRGILKEMGLLLERSIISKEKAQLVAECLAEFDDRIANNDHLHETGLIHSDINETNVLMIEKDGQRKITGLLDFGDVHESFRIIDIASTVLYLHLSDKQKQGVPSLTNAVLEGYRRVRGAPDCTHLITAMKARLSCSLIYGLRTARINLRGGNVDYVLRTQSNGWSVLQELHHEERQKKGAVDDNWV